MPEVLAGATEAAIATWLVSPDERIAQGQTVAEIETDKATVELAAERSGVVGRLLTPEGVSVAVGQAILVILEDGDRADSIDAALEADGVGPPTGESGSADPVAKPAAASAASSREPEESEQPPQSVAALQHNTRLFTSPIVRQRAAQSGISLAELTGTGPGGRIVRRDLEHHLKHAAPRSGQQPEKSGYALLSVADETSYEDVPLGRMRRAIAQRLTESKSTVPHFYLIADCHVDELLELRKTINASAARKISLNDLIIKAAAAAFATVPSANAIWNKDSIRRFNTVDISVAVATADGLVTPTLRSVERKTLTEVSASMADLVERGRNGALLQHELEGGSLAVSNLGMYGTAEFSAILNPPQSGILAVGAARAMPIVNQKAELAVGIVMTVTLSADHRVLDGALAAEWLAAFQQNIENPLGMLI